MLLYEDVDVAKIILNILLESFKKINTIQMEDGKVLKIHVENHAYKEQAWFIRTVLGYPMGNVRKTDYFSLEVKSEGAEVVKL